MNNEREVRPKIEGYITYCWDEGAITVKFDSETVHPHKFLIEDVLLRKMPVIEFKYHDYSVHEYLDTIRTHVFSCKEDCKQVLEENRIRRMGAY